MNATSDDVEPADFELISKIMMVGFILGPCFASCLHWVLTRKQKNRHFVKLPRVEPMTTQLDDLDKNIDATGPIATSGVTTGAQIPEIVNENENYRTKSNFSVISSV